jgi:CHASE2 domain-containing sensor protein
LQAVVSYLRFNQLAFAAGNLERLDAFGRAAVALYLLAVSAAGWGAARKHLLEYAGATVAVIGGLLFCVAGWAGLPPFAPMILALGLNLALLGEAQRVRR